MESNADKMFRKLGFELIYSKDKMACYRKYNTTKRNEVYTEVSIFEDTYMAQKHWDDENHPTLIDRELSAAIAAKFEEFDNPSLLFSELKVGMEVYDRCWLSNEPFKIVEIEDYGKLWIIKFSDGSSVTFEKENIEEKILNRFYISSIEK